MRRGVQADLSITDGEPELKGVMARTQPGLPSQRCLFHAPRDLYRALYRDEAQGECAYWEERLRQELWKPSMKLLDELAKIAEQIELELDVRLTDGDFHDVIHIFVHEACHAALSNRVPWIHNLTDEHYTAVDEILARVLEDQMSLLLQLPAHTPEQHVHELGMYPVRITVEQYQHLRTEWQQRYGPDKDLQGMATYTLNYLFPGEKKGDCV